MRNLRVPERDAPRSRCSRRRGRRTGRSCRCRRRSTSPSPAALMAIGMSARAVSGQVVRAVERHGAVDRRVVRVLVAVVFVDAGVHQDGVARACTRGRPDGGPVRAGAPVVVGAHQPFERRFDLLPLEAVRIDVERRGRRRTASARAACARSRRGAPRRCTPSGSVSTNCTS